MTDSQKMAAEIFKAGMQIQVINASMGNMMMFLSNNDEKKALELLRLNRKECESMKITVYNVAQAMKIKHESQINEMKDNIDLLATIIGSESIKEIMDTQKRHEENLK